LREVFGGTKNLSLRGRHVFWPAGDHENGLFSTHWSLDVGIGLGTKGLDLAACTNKMARSCYNPGESIIILPRSKHKKQPKFVKQGLDLMQDLMQ